MYSSNNQSLSISRNEDFWIHDLDPMIEGGYVVAYNRQCPFQIRQKQENEEKEYGKKTILNVRLLVIPASEEQYSELKIQLSSQSDLFMVMEEKINEKKFNFIKKQQSLNFSYQALLPMFVKQFNLCYKQPEQFFVVISRSKVGNNLLTMIQNIQYKNIELMELNVTNVDEERLKDYVSYRFRGLKAKNQKQELNTKEMLELVKLKNPNLLQNIFKKSHPTSARQQTSKAFR